MIKDILGREILEGDIVARAIYSGHTFHKVLRITPKGIKLSRGRSTRSYNTRWYRNEQTGRFEIHDTTIVIEYEVFGGANTVEEVEQHTASIYLLQDRISLVLV